MVKVGVENLTYGTRNCRVHVYNEYSCPRVGMQLQEVRVKRNNDLAERDASSTIRPLLDPGPKA